MADEERKKIEESVESYLNELYTIPRVHSAAEAIFLSRHPNPQENEENPEGLSPNHWETQPRKENGEWACRNEADESKNEKNLYTGGRTNQELKELAADPAHKGSTRPIDIKKGQYEALIGLNLEEKGVLKKIIRDPTGRAEFIDEFGQAWDIKSFNSNYKPKKGGFRLDKAMAVIISSLSENENVIIDTSNMSVEHIKELKNEILKQKIETHILFWP